MSAAECCPYCGPLTEAGTYRDDWDPPRARYCARCGRPVVGADLSRDDERAAVVDDNGGTTS